MLIDRFILVSGYAGSRCEKSLNSTNRSMFSREMYISASRLFIFVPKSMGVYGSLSFSS